MGRDRGERHRTGCHHQTGSMMKAIKGDDKTQRENMENAIPTKLPRTGEQSPNKQTESHAIERSREVRKERDSELSPGSGS